MAKLVKKVPLATVSKLDLGCGVAADEFWGEEKNNNIVDQYYKESLNTQGCCQSQESIIIKFTTYKHYTIFFNALFPFS